MPTATIHDRGVALVLQSRGKSRKLDLGAAVHIDDPNRIPRCWCVMNVGGRMSPSVKTRYIALVLVFAFCQVIGAVCALPDLSVAEGTMLFVEEGMVCPMEGTTMCPPSAMSSPERQLKNGAAADADQTSAVPSVFRILTNLSGKPQWSWSSDFSLVPLSITSSSVLRI